MTDYAAIIERSIAHAQSIMDGYDLQAREDMRNRIAQQQAQHAADMARLEFERERASTLTAFCRVARVDFERWLQERGITAT